MRELRELIKGGPLLAAAFFLFFAAYSNSLGNPFLRDDIPHIADNDFVRSPAPAKLFSAEYFLLSGAVAYRPAVTAARFAEYRLWGLNPAAWRFFNLLLHAANAVLLFLIVLRLGGAPFAAAAAAALFLLHPAHTEALNYISNGQCDIQALFFLLAAFLAWLDGRRALCAAGFALAVLSKEMALAFPLVLALYAAARGTLKKEAGFHAGMIAAAAAFAVWRVVYFRPGQAFLDNVMAEGAFAFSWPAALKAAAGFPALAVYYVKLLLWPSALSPEIDRLLPEAGFFSPARLALCWAALAACLALAARAARRGPWPLFFTAAFHVSLLPVSGLVPLTSRLQEHFVYMPSVLFCAAAGLALARLPRLRSAALLAALLLFVPRVWSRNQDWRSPLALAESDLRSFPRSARAMSGLAARKLDAGLYAEGLSLAEKAAAADPGLAEARFLAAEGYLRAGRKAEALAAAEAGAPQRGPDQLVNLARIYAGAGLLDKAEAAAAEAAGNYPYFEPAFYTLGEICLMKKDLPCAERNFTGALRLNPRSLAGGRLKALRGQAPRAGRG